MNIHAARSVFPGHFLLSSPLTSPLSSSLAPTQPMASPTMFGAELLTPAPATAPPPCPLGPNPGLGPPVLSATGVKISNITNSTDPQAINSRIFVGNLNTFTVTKDVVESVFKRYGKIIGISMHKGYAFVQYTNEQDARNAVAGEDQRVYAGQQIDVNMASEPKPNRPNRKRPQGAGAEWDFYYNVPIVPGRATGPLHVPMKRPRPDYAAAAAISAANNAVLPPTVKKRNFIQLGTGSVVAKTPVSGYSSFSRKMTSTKETSSSESSPKPAAANGCEDNPDDSDILICGTCKQTFTDVERLVTHKKRQCQLRFACKCQEVPNGATKTVASGSSLTCATCRVEFPSCWQLVQHCQDSHGMNIYVNKADRETGVTTPPGLDGEGTVEDGPPPLQKQDSEDTDQQMQTTSVLNHSTMENGHDDLDLSPHEEMTANSDAGSSTCGSI